MSQSLNSVGGGVNFTIRSARTADIAPIMELMQPLVIGRVLLGKDRAVLYSAVNEFKVAVDEQDRVIACGALHVFWEDLGEIRTVVVSSQFRGCGLGQALVRALEEQAAWLGLKRLFCLTFETEFFARLGFEPIGEEAAAVSQEVYSELLLSPDEGAAEFLNLSRVKPNTLGNTRMMKYLNQ